MLMKTIELNILLPGVSTRQMHVILVPVAAIEDLDVLERMAVLREHDAFVQQQGRTWLNLKLPGFFRVCQGGFDGLVCLGRDYIKFVYRRVIQRAHEGEILFILKYMHHSSKGRMIFNKY